ncbi:MAG: ScpA family protein [Albidovulum sp.]|nr:ScpA family protein [Albidovulum sp.]MDE0306247.1 ScpA family protein [Albidovulum sp.]MDE0531289.1 ScpA family protein [Albidovulum sp.]
MDPEWSGDEVFVVDVAGFEGPLDFLLALARRQRVDLSKISILELVEQYLAFTERARSLRIELAAEYLVMAAWLAFLKSRLLLPREEEGGPSGEELAANLAFRLERLSAMRESAARIMGLARLGMQVFPRGSPENLELIKQTKYTATIYDLMEAYARVRSRENLRPYSARRDDVYSVEAALEHLTAIVGHIPNWAELNRFLPVAWLEDAEKARSATASTLAACLELAKSGQVEMRQADNFAPIQVRRKRDDGDG